MVCRDVDPPGVRRKVNKRLPRKKISAAKAAKNVSTKGGVQKKKVAVSKRKSAVKKEK